MKHPAPYDLVLEDATIATFSHKGYIHESANVGIQDGKIAEVSNQRLAGKESISLRGLHLLPGVIDSQVHFREPGMTQKEDLETGTRSAALGGVTAVFEMPNTVPATTTRELLEEKFRRADGRCWVDHAFYIGGSPENISQLAELERMSGCPGIKIFMGSSTGTLLVEDDATLEKIFLSGRRRVILHSEDEYRLRERKYLAVESGHVRAHYQWRDVESAVSSTRRLLHLAEKTLRPVHVLHVSTAEEMDLLSHHKHLATVEVLPQHLTLSAPDCYERLGTLAQQNPPIRELRHQEALWKALQKGTVDVIGSDHAPHTLEEKGKPYPATPSGVPGVQTLVPLMLNHVHNGKLTLQRFIELVCENPRWVFGCKSRGRIEVGLEANFTVVDLKRHETISNSWIASKVGWTPFDGMKVTGWPVGTMVGGNFVMRDSQMIGKPLGQAVQFIS